VDAGDADGAAASAPQAGKKRAAAPAKVKAEAAADSWAAVSSFLHGTVGVRLGHADASSNSSGSSGSGSSGGDEPSGGPIVVHAAAAGDRIDLPPIVHVFSHQRHTMHVSVLRVSVRSGAPKSGSPFFQAAGSSSSSSSSSSSGGDDVSGGHGPAAVPAGWTSLCGGQREVRWMSVADITAAGVTTGCKKVLAAVTQALALPV
jgi:hypothetical protein